MTVYVIGNATLDLTYRIARFPAMGETVLCTARRTGPGGKGLNQAVAAARAGATVRFHAPFGQDATAGILRDRLALEPDLHLHAWIREGLPSDESSIWVAADGENQIVSTAECARSVTPDEVAAALKQARTGDVLALQGNLSEATTAAALQSGRAAGMVTVVNPAPVGFGFEMLKGRVDVLVVNRIEAAALGIDPDADDLIGFAKGLGGAVIVTLGGESILYAQPDGAVGVHPVRTVVPVDTTGAGDAFVGTLCAALDRRATLALAIADAANAGRQAVLTLGGLPEAAVPQLDRAGQGG